MSYKKPMNDTQQGVSRTRDATVPRPAKLPISRHDLRREADGPAGGTRSVSRSPTFMNEPSTTQGRPLRLQSRPKVPALRSTVSSRNPSAPAAAKRSAASSNSMSQEVPLLMETTPVARAKDHAATSRRPGRPLESARGTQSGLDTHHDEIFGIVMPRSNTSTRPADLPPRLIPELQALAASTRPPELVNGSVSSIGSPSTRFSSSPSPWSASTTATTPTSWSSASPGIFQPAGAVSSGRRSQAVPIPPGRREMPPKMPALPESLAQPGESGQHSRPKEKTRASGKRKTPLSTPAPTPPPRTSSAKHSLSRSSSKSDRLRARSDLEPTPSMPDSDQSPLARLGQADLGGIGDSLQHGMLARAHDSLQQSLGGRVAQPRRPHPVPTGELRHLSPNKNHTGSTGRHHGALNTEDEGPSEQIDTMMQPTSYPSVEQRPITPGGQSTDSPGRLGKFSRLGLFGRRGKSPAAEVERSPRKLQRKGPAAGTGYEGYGKHAKRGRTISQESSPAKNSESERSVSSTRRVHLFGSKGKHSRSSSRHNRNSQSDLDDFAATRMRPVPMIGGSGSSLKSHSGSRTEVDSSALPLTDPNLDNWATPSQSQTSIRQQPLRDLSGASRYQESHLGNGPTLALRRSQRFGSDEDAFNLPRPIRTENLSALVFISSREEDRSSAAAASMSTTSITTDLNRGDSTLQRPQYKKPRKLRWNIFRRKDAEPEPLRTGPPSSSPEEMSVSVSSVPVSRTMPYYAMMDSESEVNPTDQIGDYLSQVVESPAASPFVGGHETELPDEEQLHTFYDNEILLPSAPVSPPQSFVRSPPAVPLRNPNQHVESQSGAPPQKQPRLVRVGRIPPVGVRTERPETTERQHKPNRTSFSQPFARDSVSEDPSGILSTAGALRDLPLQIDTDVAASKILRSNESAPSGIAQGSGEAGILRFPSGQASEISASSSSDGFPSILGPPLVPGLLPRAFYGLPLQLDAHTPTSPSVDEVWNEYDDFIDQVMSPSQSRKSARTTVQGEAPIKEHAEREVRFMNSEGSAPWEQPDVALSDFPIPGIKRSMAGHTPAPSATSPVMFSPTGISERRVGEEIRLRRSRIVSALHSSMDPVSPFPVQDLLTEYEGHHRNSTKSPERLSASSAAGSLEHFTATGSASKPQREPNLQENIALLDVVERGKDPVAQSERHYASLMVAKWLSFGRVLFSPAYDEIQSIPERHILVIDGLGNEDWSIYCAVTYEAQRAFVHDLKEKASIRGSKGSRPSQHAPENHRRAEVASFYERFPFPPAFFSVVVVRFPPAMAEAKMKNIIAECRRVLLPGGHLELMLLDLDIVNMGVQTRRAVRALKLRMTTADKQLSLMPIIDNVQGVVGARGFTNISRCVVGVPVAGRPAGSTDSSSSSRSSGGSDGLPKSGSGGTRQANTSPRMMFGHGRRGTNLSLNELIADHSDNADFRISKIVSRTARTWWQHCFEASVIDDGNLGRSIFADRTVLGECKARGSSFKMLIAYAQRPVFEPRRRTMSEPVVSTLVTAGGQRKGPPPFGGSNTA